MADMTEKQITRLGIIGAGTMGAGIARIAAESGCDVMLVDVAEEWLDRGLQTIASGLDRLVSRGDMTVDDRDHVLGRIEGSTHIAHVSDCDLVIEAVSEQLELKKSVFCEVAGVIAPDAIIASNTSSISITELAASISGPERVAGMHFFNPVPVLKLVEIVRGLQTSDETVSRIRALAEKMGKTPIDVGDVPGFVANRLLLPMINEAVFCLAEGVAGADDIDTIMKLGAAHPIGPLALADLIGLDVCLAIMEMLHQQFGDDKYRPAPLLRKMAAAGRLGRKTGRGFHTYPAAS